MYITYSHSYNSALSGGRAAGILIKALCAVWVFLRFFFCVIAYLTDYGQERTKYIVAFLNV